MNKLLSDYIKNHGKQQVFDYLGSLGFPLYDGANWRPTKFNLTERLYDKAFRWKFFLLHKIARCVDPRNSEEQIFCWQFNLSFDFLHKNMVTYPDKTRKDFWNMLTAVNSTLTVDDAILRSSIDRLLLFFQQKVDSHYQLCQS